MFNRSLNSSPVHSSPFIQVLCLPATILNNGSDLYIKRLNFANYSVQLNALANKISNICKEDAY